MLNLFSKKIKNSKSDRGNTGYKGISERKDKNYFQAQVVVYTKNGIKNGKVSQKTIFVENKPTLKEAIKAREEFIDNLY